MNHSLFVCLLASTLSLMSAAQGQTPPMRKGISVQMALTNNATPKPEADNEDAWIITITADDRLFFGVKPVTPEGLTQLMIATPRHRDQSLYIKADARSRFGTVRQALNSGGVDGFESAVLLTNQHETPAMGKLVTPKGLEVLVVPVSAQPVTVRLRNSGEKVPTVQVNDREIMMSDLQDALNQALREERNRLVQLQADDTLEFAQVAQVIDACSSVKAIVVIASDALHKGDL